MNTTTDKQTTESWWALRFIGLIVALRLIWHFFEPVGMAGDETYYWLWGQYPDLGYFSKPPLIGWLYGGLTALFGKSVFVYKSAATLLGAGTLWFFYRTLQQLTGNNELARWGLLAMALVPAGTLLSSILTIDAPLMFCWTGGMYFTARLLTSDQPKRGDYIGLLLMLALGHLAKQMMLVQLPLIIAMAAIYKRSLLLAPLFWLTLVGSLASLIPPLIWNAQNEWITVEHTAHHFEPAKATVLDALGRLGEFWGALAGLISPILFVLFFPALKTGWVQRRKVAVTFFVLFGAAGLIVMSAMTYRQRVNPNWPAVFLPASLGLMLLWAFANDARKRWFKRGLWVAGGMSACLMVLLLLLEPLSGPLANLGVKPQRRGWQGYPQLVEQISALSAEADQLIFVGHRFTASQFAFHGPDPKRVHLWNDSGQIMNQFDFFNEPETGKATLIVVEQKKAKSKASMPGKLEELAGKLTLLDELPMHPARDYPRFKIYLADHLEDWILR